MQVRQNTYSVISGEGGSKWRRILKAARQNQTRPVSYRVRSPPQFSGKRWLYSAGAAMNFIVCIRLLPALPVISCFNLHRAEMKSYCDKRAISQF
jgi:hypothetical protein